MGQSNYRKGYEFEYWAGETIKEMGGILLRSGGSKGPFDLVAHFKDESSWSTVWLQLKVNGWPSRKELDTLARLSDEKNILVEVWRRDDGDRWIKRKRWKPEIPEWFEPAKWENRRKILEISRKRKRKKQRRPQQASRPNNSRRKGKNR